MNDELLSILAHARIAAMLEEAQSYRLMIERRPVPPPNETLTLLRNRISSLLYRAADVIAVEALR
jgi:hypothetical protein